MRTLGDDDSTSMDKGCCVVGCDELPSVIVFRVLRMWRTLHCNKEMLQQTFYVATSKSQHNMFASGETTTSSRDNHVTENVTSYLATKHLVVQHVFYGKTTSSRNKLPWVVATGTCKPFFYRSVLNLGPSRDDHGWIRVRLWSLARDNYSRGHGGTFIIRQVVRL